MRRKTKESKRTKEKKLESFLHAVLDIFFWWR